MNALTDKPRLRVGGAIYSPAGDLTLETEAASVQKPGAPAGALDQDVGNDGGHQGEGSRHRSLDGSSTHLLA